MMKIGNSCGQYILEALRDEAPEDLVKEKSFVHLLAAEERNRNNGCHRVLVCNNGVHIALSGSRGSTD